MSSAVSLAQRNTARTNTGSLVQVVLRLDLWCDSWFVKGFQNQVLATAEQPIRLSVYHDAFISLQAPSRLARDPA